MAAGAPRESPGGAGSVGRGRRLDSPVAAPPSRRAPALPLAGAGARSGAGRAARTRSLRAASAVNFAPRGSGGGRP